MGGSHDSRFSLAVSFEDGTTVVEAKGKLDMATVHRFQEAFTHLDPGTRAVVVDLTGLTSRTPPASGHSSTPANASPGTASIGSSSSRKGRSRKCCGSPT